MIATIVFMVGAFVADYFRLPIPTEPLEKLQRIANDRPGWTAQAILFPVVYLVTAVFHQRPFASATTSAAQPQASVCPIEPWP